MINLIADPESARGVIEALSPSLDGCDLRRSGVLCATGGGRKPRPDSATKSESRSNVPFVPFVPFWARPLLGVPFSNIRIRLRNYRIVYEVQVKEIVIFVVGTAHHREVYRRILKRR